MCKLTLAALILGSSMASLTHANVVTQPDDDWCKTPGKTKPHWPPVPGPTFPMPPKFPDDTPRPWDPTFPPELPRRMPPILRPVVLLDVTKQDGPAKQYARLEGRQFFQGEWAVAYTLRNNHPTRSLKVKVKRMIAGPALWPQVQSAYYVLAPGETEDLGSVGQSFKKVGTPEIEGAWYADEVAK